MHEKTKYLKNKVVGHGKCINCQISRRIFTKNGVPFVLLFQVRKILAVNQWLSKYSRHITI